MRKFIASLLTLTLLLPSTVPAVTSNDLPDIGSPSNSVLSRDKEQQIGRSIYRSLIDTNRILNDPEIQEYVQDLGLKLAVQAQDGNFRFTFL